MSREAPTLRFRSRHHRILLWLLIAAVLARLVAAILVGGEEFRFADESMYLDAAAGMRGRPGLPRGFANAPGYPAFLTLAGLFVPAGVLPVRMLQASIAAAGLLLCYGVGRRLGGPRAGIASAAVYSLDPLLVVSSGLLYPEPVAALLLTGSVLAAWDAGRRDQLRLAALAGLQLGLLVLFRPVGLALAPAMIAWVGLGQAGPWRRRGARMLLLGGACGLVLLPWVRDNYRDSGRLLPAATAVRDIPGLGQEAERRGVAQAIVSSAVREPGMFARRTLREFGHFWELYPTRLATDDPALRASLSERDPRLSEAPLVQRSLRDLVSGVTFGLELALAATGLALGWRARRRETLWLVGVVLSFAFGYALIYGKLRYRIPVLPIVYGFAGLGLAALAARLPWDPLRAAAPPAEGGVRP